MIAQEVIPALGHDIINTYYEEQNGFMMLVEICSRCGMLTSEVDVTKPVKVNNYNDLVTILNAGYDTLITESLDLPTGIDISKDVNLTIASGVTITLKNDTMGLGAFRATKGATLTIDSKGIIDGVGNNNFNMAIWANGGNVIINSGTYTNVGAIDDGTEHFDLIYASNGGSVIINGGTFIAETPKWTLNLKDNDLEAKITVYGGTFKEYDPANSKTESASANTNFVADGHLSLLNVNGYYTVYKQTSIAEALVIGGGKAHNAYTSEKYVIAGTITKIDNTQYGNMYIKDSEGKETSQNEDDDNDFSKDKLNDYNEIENRAIIMFQTIDEFKTFKETVEIIKYKYTPIYNSWYDDFSELNDIQKFNDILFTTRIKILKDNTIIDIPRKILKIKPRNNVEFK
jgi:hypothetical protein